jgi:HK97 family phage prohead protease
MKTITKRIRVQALSIKAIDDDPDYIGEVSGYATTFEPPERHDSYGEIVAKDAVDIDDPTLKDLSMLNSHGAPIGVWKSFEVVDKIPDRDVGGLKVSGRLINVSEAKDVLVASRTKAIKGLSIGFETLEREELKDHPTKWGYPVIKLNKIKLHEVSLTATPANTYATILEVRSSNRDWYNMRKKKDVLKKKSALSDFMDTTISDIVSEDEAITEESVRLSLAEALGVVDEVVSAILEGSVIPATQDQVQLLADMLQVDAAELLAELQKDLEPFMLEGEEEPPEDEAEELALEDEEELLAELSAIEEELKSLHR